MSGVDVCVCCYSVENVQELYQSAVVGLCID